MEERREASQSRDQDKFSSILHLASRNNILPIACLEKQLLDMICFQLQLLKPENVPKPPYTLGSLPISAPLSQTTPEPASASITGPSGPTAQQKGKAPASKPKAGAASNIPTQQQSSATMQDGKSKPTKRQLALPPDPAPPVSDRVSIYSPALASNVLIETVKAGMNAQAEGGPGSPGASAPPAMAKGKRKVLRVRQ